MRRERVPQGVRADVLLDPRALYVPTEDLPRAHARERFATRVEEEYPLPFTLLELRAQLAHVRRHRSNRRAPDRDEPLLAPLPKHAHEHVVEQHVAHTDRDPFRYTEAGSVRKLQHRAIAKGE